MADRSLDRLMRKVAQAVGDRRVLDAMRAVPRADFVPEPMQGYAFEDFPLPIGYGQTISQPKMVAIMTAALELSGTEHVLEIGTGSGYQAAILARLAGDVVSVEVVAELRERAAQLLKKLGIGNVMVLDPGEQLGSPAGGPYDRIVVTAACPTISAPLIEQLSVGGLLVLPVGSRTAQDLIVIRKTHQGIEETRLGGCHFVPLVGPQGFEPT